LKKPLKFIKQKITLNHQSIHMIIVKQNAYTHWQCAYPPLVLIKVLIQCRNNVLVIFGFWSVLDSIRLVQLGK